MTLIPLHHHIESWCKVFLYTPIILIKRWLSPACPNNQAQLQSNLPKLSIKFTLFHWLFLYFCLSIFPLLPLVIVIPLFSVFPPLAIVIPLLLDFPPLVIVIPWLSAFLPLAIVIPLLLAFPPLVIIIQRLLAFPPLVIVIPPLSVFPPFFINSSPF